MSGEDNSCGGCSSRIRQFFTITFTTIAFLRDALQFAFRTLMPLLSLYLCLKVSFVETFQQVPLLGTRNISMEALPHAITKVISMQTLTSNEWSN